MKFLRLFSGRKAQSSANCSRSSSSSSQGASTPPQEVDATPERRRSGSFSGWKRSFRSSGSGRRSGDQYAPPATVQQPSSVDLERQELADAFRIFDQNGDGKISAAELGAVLRSLGDNPRDEDLQLMVEAVDKDGDGYIDFQEFIELNGVGGGDGRGTAGRSEELRAAFHMFDIDRNNYISAKGLHQVLSRLGQPSLTMEDCSRMISGVDADGNGLVDFEEFETMMTKNCVC